MAITTFKSIAIAFTTAVLLGAAPQPAQAQSFFFGFGIGSDSFFEHRPFRLCLMTDSQLRREISRQGYHDIFLNVANDHRIQVRATKGDWVYLLVVNSCTGRILDRERLRPS